jgi:pimeloyl-ACP methyl ester carboxylesterase
VTARLLPVGPVELCVETFGDPGDPTVLLIHGACASLLWWPHAFCTALAARGRHVVRYDSRDTGRSTHYPAGRPPYGLRDLAADAVGILDALAVPRAHLVGRSMGGGVAMTAALDHPHRVATLTLVGTTTGDDDLPPMSPTVLDRPTSDDPVEDVVLLMRAFAGPSPFFDAEATRALAAADVARTLDLDAALTNHFAMRLDGPDGGPADIRVPTLVVHGDVDPVHPLPHGRALAAAIPGASLLVLPGTGHDLPPQRFAAVVDALVAHTARPEENPWTPPPCPSSPRPTPGTATTSPATTGSSPTGPGSSSARGRPPTSSPPSGTPPTPA